ncbi:Rv1733c family protein [Streptomyces griseoviridis]|uniref:Proline rich protein membrane protein n=1 Tax=Streptomyces griseoviridis TaxID=45398 RepID=A0ABT9LMV3_STRGD|nr:hypothetical protein [Streptomyces griseoviridis]MDP9684855.1 hypothetical protein [Streptomyces griseoviridis]GGT19743.1 hypothetical protein GCM10010240_60910 [Streptomyces griseoviridis]
MAGDVPRPARAAARRRRPNPLRRRTDRLRTRLAVGTLLAVAVLAPVAMAGAGDHAHRYFRAVAARQADARQPVTAVLVEDAPRVPAPRAEVRFTGPDGDARTARTGVAPGQPADSTVRVWVGPDGRLTDPPMTGDEIRSRAAGWALLAALGVAGTGAAAYGTAAVLLRRHDLAAWEAEWAATAPDLGRRPPGPPAPGT